MNPWAKQGVLGRVFAQLHRRRIIQVRVEAMSLDSTTSPVRTDGTGVLKNGKQASRHSRGGWTTKVHMVAADASTPVNFCLSPGQAHGTPDGQRLLADTSHCADHVIMDRAYEDNDTRQLVLDLDLMPVVPPKRSRMEP